MINYAVIVILILNLIAFVLMGVDKRRAINGRLLLRRTGQHLQRIGKVIAALVQQPLGHAVQQP